MGEKLGSLAIGLTRASETKRRREGREAGVPLDDDRAAALHSISAAGEPKRKR